jgi:glycosyltransferase involved in cell wall biosynthesis
MNARAHPLVSVCIPTYNGAGYLPRCIESVLAQTFGDFEVVIVDDCSTDDTFVVAKRYAAMDARIRVAKNDRNLGLVDNWNKCVAAATGEWIKFVFQDDTVYSDCLVEMLKAARDHTLLVACRREVVFETDTDAPTRKWYLDHCAMMAALFADEPMITAERAQERALEHFGINLFGEPTSVLVHRSAFERFGLFNPALVITCDLEQWTRISIHVGAAFVNKDLATFRVHKAATSALVHAQQSFRVNILDNLVLLHQYAFDEMYAPVRRAAFRRTPPIDLKRVFARRCHEAQARAAWANRHPTAPDEALISQWTAVSRAFPRISRGRVAHLAWRWTRHLRQRDRKPWPVNAKNFLD